VANEVETEQICYDASCIKFDMPRYTSWVQHRGSIPLYWSQEITNMAPKPKIQRKTQNQCVIVVVIVSLLKIVAVCYPFFVACCRHFSQLFQRYHTPILVLNLVKQREKTPREMILYQEYCRAIDYMNRTMPASHKIEHIAWDMARAAKSDDQDVISFLEGVAEKVLEKTGISCDKR
jgi:hypothetical protein